MLKITIRRGIKPARLSAFTVSIKQIAFYLLVMSTVFIAGQTEASDPVNEQFSIDLIQNTASPAFIILGNEPASIQKPGSISDFVLNVQNKTEDFSVLPKDYGIELALGWLISGSSFTYDSYSGQDNNLWDNFIQTVSLSIASVALPSDTAVIEEQTDLAVGLRFSLSRGRVDTEYEGYNRKLDSLRDLQRLVALCFDSLMNDSLDKDIIIRLADSLDAIPALTEDAKDAVDRMASLQQESIKKYFDDKIKEVQADNLERLRLLATGLKERRIGFVADIALGASINFPNRNFDDGNWSRLGIWTTFGYERTNYSILGLVRMIGDQHNADSSTFDIGGRFILNDVRKLSLSVESLYRSFYDSDKNDDTWRLAFILDYPLGKNKGISFTLGRDFEGNRTGNLLSMVNLVIGFGSDRPI